MQEYLAKLHTTEGAMKKGAVLDKNEPREPISAFIIACDEEVHIAECVQSVSFCDEVIVVDSFSKDRTVEIASKNGAKVIERIWPGYKEQKAFALGVTSNEWVINLDADERVSPELRDEIINVLRNEYEAKQKKKIISSDGIVGYYISRVVFFKNRWWRNGGWYPEYRLRFFKKRFVTWGGVDPHEKPIIDGRTAKLKGEIYHFTYRDFRDQLDRLQHFSSLAAEEEFKLGTKFKISSLLVNPFLRTVKFFIFKKGYREGVLGFIVAVFEGYYTFMKYAKLWELYADKEQGKGA